MPHKVKRNKRFVIKVGDTYYLTTGKLLEYNMSEAEDEPDEQWREKMKEGVRQMEEEFQAEYDRPNTWYPAVEFTKVAYSGINTGPQDGS